MYAIVWFFFFQAEDGIRDLVRSRGLGDVYKRQARNIFALGSFDEAAQNRIGIRIGHAILGRHVQLLSLIHI